MKTHLLSGLFWVMLTIGLATGLHAQITANASLTPAVLTDGSSMTLTRNGSTTATFAYTENVIQRPDNSTVDLGHLAMGSMSYTPNGGPGVYWYLFKVRDVNGAYASQSIPFVVGSITPHTALSLTMSVGESWTKNFDVHSQDRLITRAQLFRDSSYDGEPDVDGGTDTLDWPVFFQPWTAGTHTLRLLVTSTSYGPDGAATPPTPGAPSEVNWYRDFAFTVNKTTPVGTWYPSETSGYFASGSTVFVARSGYYFLTSGDVSQMSCAIFTHPSYSDVTESYQPGYVAGTGSPVTYRLAGTSTALAVAVPLPAGTTSIEAVYPGNANYNSATATTTVTVGALGMPAVSPIFGSSFMLTWTAVPGATAYDIYRNGVSIATAVSGTSYVDTTVPTTVTVTYVVRAYSGAYGSFPGTAVIANPGGVLEVFSPAL